MKFYRYAEVADVKPDPKGELSATEAAFLAIARQGDAERGVYEFDMIEWQSDQGYSVETGKRERIRVTVEWPDYEGDSK